MQLHLFSPFADILSAVLTEALECSPKPLRTVLEVETAVGLVLCFGLVFSVFPAHRDFLFFLAWLYVSFFVVFATLDLFLPNVHNEKVIPIQHRRSCS